MCAGPPNGYPERRCRSTEAWATPRSTPCRGTSWTRASCRSSRGPTRRWPSRSSPAAWSNRQPTADVSDASQLTQPARPPLGMFARLATAVPFGLLSAARRSRIFHPVGVAFEATLTIDKGAAPIGLLTPGEHRAVVRLSRGVGLPEPLPDVLGIAVKLPDVDGYGGDQDLLLVTSGQRPVMRQLLLPARSFTGQTYSTVLVFRVGTERVLFGLEAVDVDRPHSLDELRATDDASDISFILTMAP